MLTQATSGFRFGRPDHLGRSDCPAVPAGSAAGSADLSVRFAAAAPTGFLDCSDCPAVPAGSAAGSADLSVRFAAAAPTGFLDCPAGPDSFGPAGLVAPAGPVGFDDPAGSYSLQCWKRMPAACCRSMITATRVPN